MKTVSGILGLLLIWAGSLEWCREVWYEMWPSGAPILLPLIGGVLVLSTSYYKSDGRLIVFSLAALIPPFIILAMRGFRI